MAIYSLAMTSTGIIYVGYIVHDVVKEGKYDNKNTRLTACVVQMLTRCSAGWLLTLNEDFNGCRSTRTSYVSSRLVFAAGL
jgi:hypothetical protein